MNICVFMGSENPKNLIILSINIKHTLNRYLNNSHAKFLNNMILNIGVIQGYRSGFCNLALWLLTYRLKKHNWTIVSMHAYGKKSRTLSFMEDSLTENFEYLKGVYLIKVMVIRLILIISLGRIF